MEVDPDDAAAAARAKGGVPDEQLVGDVGGAIEALRALPNASGKVGVIGYCSGGRQSFLTAVSLPVDAAVDCYGAFVTGTLPEGFPLKAVPLVDRTASLRCPLLGLFGAEDQYPSPEHVEELEQALLAHHKTYEFHSYEGAGTPSSTPTARPTARRPRSTVGGGSSRGSGRTSLRRRPDHVLLSHRVRRRGGQRQGSRRLVFGDLAPRSTSTIRSMRRSTTRSTSTSPIRPPAPGRGWRSS